MITATKEIDRRLKLVARDAMLIAIVLVGVGVAGTALVGVTRGFAIPTAALLLLIAPGGWYAYVSLTLTDADVPLVKWTMRVAMGQLCLCVLAIPIGVMIDPTFLVAVALMMFFVPALLALLFQLWRARDLIRARELARGFAVAAPDPIAEEIVGTAETVEEAQLYIDNDRGK